MSIDLGGGDIGMTQHHLHGTQIGAARQEMGSKRMAKSVGMHFMLQSRLGGVLLHQFPEALPTKFCSGLIQK